MIQLAKMERYLITIIIGLGVAGLTRILMVYIEETDHLTFNEFTLKDYLLKGTIFSGSCKS